MPLPPFGQGGQGKVRFYKVWWGASSSGGRGMSRLRLDGPDVFGRVTAVKARRVATS